MGDILQKNARFAVNTDALWASDQEFNSPRPGLVM
jgi:hypothetical protein